MDRLNDCANTAEAEVASLRKDNERLRAELAEANGERQWVVNPMVDRPDTGWGFLCFFHGAVAFVTPLVFAVFFVAYGSTPEVVRAAMVVPPITASWFIAWMRREVK